MISMTIGEVIHGEECELIFSKITMIAMWFYKNVCVSFVNDNAILTVAKWRIELNGSISVHFDFTNRQ